MPEMSLVMKLLVNYPTSAKKCGEFKFDVKIEKKSFNKEFELKLTLI